MIDKNIPDQLILYRGHSHKINDYISIHVPTLEEICLYGGKAHIFFKTKMVKCI